MDNNEITKELVAALNAITRDTLLQFNQSMTVQEAAEFLRVGRNMIYTHVHAGLPHYWIGNRMTFSMRDLLEWRERFRHQTR